MTSEVTLRNVEEGDLPIFETARPLVARVAKHNIGSIRVLRRCGFTVSGEDRFPVADGEYGEEYIFTLTRR